MNKFQLEIVFKVTTSVGSIGLLMLGMRQEYRQRKDDLDIRFNKVYDKISNLDTKFTS